MGYWRARRSAFADRRASAFRISRRWLCLASQTGLFFFKQAVDFLDQSEQFFRILLVRSHFTKMHPFFFLLTFHLWCPGTRDLAHNTTAIIKILSCGKQRSWIYNQVRAGKAGVSRLVSAKSHAHSGFQGVYPQSAAIVTTLTIQLTYPILRTSIVPKQQTAVCKQLRVIKVINPRRQCMSYQGVPKVGRSGLVLTGCVLAILCAVSVLYSRSNRAVASAKSPSSHSLPLTFEANLGQTDSAAKYIARGHGYTLFLTENGAVWSLASPTPSKSKNQSPRSTSSALRMELVGASNTLQISASDRQAGVSNYFVGSDPKQWRSGIPHYGRVEYSQIYPGIDEAIHGDRQQLMFDFQVAPGADPSQISLLFSGTTQISTDDSGDIWMCSPAGAIALHKPIAYQIINGKRRSVDTALRSKSGKVMFAIANYDKKHALFVSPTLSVQDYSGELPE